MDDRTYKKTTNMSYRKPRLYADKEITTLKHTVVDLPSFSFQIKTYNFLKHKIDRIDTFYIKFWRLKFNDI